MGVLKELEFKKTGIMLGYWRINCVSVDIETNITEVRVGGYISKNDALAGKKAIDNIGYKFIGHDNPIGLMTDPRDYQTLLYAKIIAPSTNFSANVLAGGELVSDMPE